MRVTREKMLDNHERIVTAAAQLFAEKGFDNVGVDAIMDRVGLTHGGFYRHFRSKEDLAIAALAQGLAAGGERLGRHATLEDYITAYLSPGHRDNPAEGCLIAALASDVARQGAGVRDELTAHVPQALARLGARMAGVDPAERRKQAIMALAGMVGALVLARAVNDKALSDEILASARDVLGGSLCPKTGAAP